MHVFLDKQRVQPCRMFRWSSPRAESSTSGTCLMRRCTARKLPCHSANLSPGIFQLTYKSPNLALSFPVLCILWLQEEQRRVDLSEALMSLRIDN